MPKTNAIHKTFQLYVTYVFVVHFLQSTKIALPLRFVDCYSHRSFFNFFSILHTCTKRWDCRCWRRKKSARFEVTRRADIPCEGKLLICLHFKFEENCSPKIRYPKIVYLIRATLYCTLENAQHKKIPIKWLLEWNRIRIVQHFVALKRVWVACDNVILAFSIPDQHTEMAFVEKWTNDRT